MKAITSNVEELDLGFEYSHLELPPSVFSCKTLVVLKLSGRIRIMVPSTACLPNLKSLYLNFLRFLDDESAANLISCCVALENLSIQRNACDEVRKLRIHKPTLRSFKIHYGNNIFYTDRDREDETILELNAPALQYLDVKYYISDPLLVANVGSLYKATLDLNKGRSCLSLIRCLEAFSNVKFLSLSGLTRGLKLEQGFPSVKLLKLTHLTLGARCVWRPMLPDFLQCFEKLEVLGLTKVRVIAAKNQVSRTPN
ncbi:OLC1v1035632C1 [Oldenlandia corymbosa var. corymbosa]|uniref:OLC1v1035632C1 n=1 Tax=Oldenlandia corymbosa var. corymbosa TaxID=529605 RepID=A0AAV1CUA0_OLDCO|nr:OLC1v1035632C1 [Oldenlandia corymbosa var. corymbosa]